jgi:hypothetical protein
MECVLLFRERRDGYAVRVRDGRGPEFVWDTCYDCGDHLLKIEEGSSKPRFLLYQPIWDGNSNHIFCEEPALLHAGIWLIAPSKNGYERRAVVTNPLSLWVRNPGGVAHKVEKP